MSSLPTQAEMDAVKTARRYFIGNDQSGHRYIVPLDQRGQWDAWCSLDEDDEEAWEVPDDIDAVRIDGAFVSFIFPVVLA